jgi:uncharacterized protein DUF6518
VALAQNYSASAAYLFAIVAGLAFGAADQYLGSRSALGAGTASVSGLSAPWLVLPFVAGMTQDRDRRALGLDLVATASALVGYFAMTYSPMENVPLERFFSGVIAMVRSGYNPLWIVGGMVIGPLYGLLGQRWRVDRSWISAALVTCALCFEPLARRVVGMLSPPPFVWAAEVAVGAIVAISFTLMIATARHAREMVPPTPPTV